MIKRTIILLFFSATLVFGADSSNSPPRMPPHGLPVPQEIRAELERGTAALGRDIEELKSALASKPALLELLPDAQIYYNAVRYALADDMFYKTNDFALAKKLLAQGEERVSELRAGHAPWNTDTGLVVRGYVSRIDGSIIPYGLVVPASYSATTTNAHRLDLWFHGRNEKLGELSFIEDRQKNPGEFTPPDTFVLHPYGRYCNGFKFAGEVDVFEALAHVRKHYPIETNHISVRGFSMGGAATWHLGVHYAGEWAAVAPGAGFVETAIFTKAFEKNPPPTWYEQKLWHLYDATDYAGNLFNTHVVAYSGEIDGQRQAAELMSKAMAAEGMELTHIIGPNTAHKYEPEAKKKVAELVDGFADAGRNSLPRQVKFTTWTLKYNQMDWVTVDGMEKEWDRARVNAEIRDDKEIVITTTNVSALTLEMPAGLCPFAVGTKPHLELDDWEVSAPAVESNRAWTVHLAKNGNRWVATKSFADGQLKKRHGLQGPIDDAFMDSFIMVRPTGKPLNEQVGAWATNNMNYAIEQWHLQFRGEARVKDDTAITDDDIANNNLILWGDTQGNKLLARIANKIPIHWTGDGIRTSSAMIHERPFSADSHVVTMVYPNPLNPKRYVVLNTGFTFSETGRPSNALQIPKLPDYAVIDITVPLAERIPKGVVDAGFFNEEWNFFPIED